MKRERLYRLLALAAILITALTVGLLVGGCCDDCPTCPKEPHVPDYHLVYSYVEKDATGYWILTYGTKSGQVIDSTFYPFPGDPFQDLQFSHDGEYACYTTNYSYYHGTSETWVTRTATGDTVAYLSGTGGWYASISRSGQYLLITGGRLIAILTFPELAVVCRDSVDSYRGVFHPSRKRAFVTLEQHMDSVIVLDFDETSVTRTSVALHNKMGDSLISVGPIACTDHALVVNPGLEGVTNYIQLYDPDSLKLIRELPTRFYYCHQLHPDGKRLFLGYIDWWDGYWPNGGGVDVYDLEANVKQSYFALDEVYIGPEEFAPSHIQVTPDGEKMYVLSGNLGFWLGPILEVQIATKQITRRFDNTTGSSRLIRLNPKDWAE